MPDAPQEQPQSILPQFLQLMMGGGQQQPQAPAPAAAPMAPTNPTQPQLEPQQVASQAMQRGTQLTEEQLQRGRGLGDKATAIAAMPYQTPDPIYGPGPSKPGFFHTLSHAFRLLGDATLPGRAIEGEVYAHKVSARKAEEEGRAEKIKTYLEGQKQEYEPVGATARMGPAYMSASARMESADASKQRAEAYTQSVQNHLTTALAGLDIRKLLSGDKVETDKARTKLMAERNKIAEESVQERYYGVDQTNATRMGIANTLQQMGMDKTHPFFTMVDSMFGTSLTPAAPQVAAGAQPVTGEKPLPKRSQSAKPGAAKAGPPTGATHIGTSNKDGKDHYLDAQGKDLGPVK